MRHENEKPPAPGVKDPWYSLDYTFIMEPGEAKLPRPPIQDKAKTPEMVPQVLPARNRASRPWRSEHSDSALRSRKIVAPKSISIRGTIRSFGTKRAISENIGASLLNFAGEFGRAR